MSNDEGMIKSDDENRPSKGVRHLCIRDSFVIRH
jgi:hypothetical protein